MPADHPIEALRGKSQAELLAVTEQLAAALSQPPAPPPPPTPVAGPTNEDWMYRPNEAARMIAEARMAEALNPVQQMMDGFRKQNSETIRALANQRFASEFQRWGSEIDGHMAQVPMENRTLDAYEKVVTFVRGKHFDELAREKAEQMLASGALGERSGGGVPGAPNGNGVNLANLPPEFKTALERTGMNQRDVLEFCQKTGTPVEKWVESATAGKAFTSIAPFKSFTLNEEAVGGTRRFDG